MSDAEEVVRTIPKNYHKYGFASHSKIAKTLNISTSLSHKSENDVMLKFAICYFQPPWTIKNDSLRHLKNASGELVRFQEVGECFEVLAEIVQEALGTDTGSLEFKKEFEKRIVEISKHIDFRKFVLSLLKQGEVK